MRHGVLRYGRPPIWARARAPPRLISSELRHRDPGAEPGRGGQVRAGHPGQQVRAGQAPKPKSPSSRAGVASQGTTATPPREAQATTDRGGTFYLVRDRARARVRGRVGLRGSFNQPACSAS